LGHLIANPVCATNNKFKINNADLMARLAKIKNIIALKDNAADYNFSSTILT